MARHYKQTRQDRRDESEGMEEHEEHRTRHPSKGYYGRGHGEFANMPTEVEMREYPSPYSDLEREYPDTIQEIDRDLEDAVHKTESEESKSMY
jgi:hypothetical protein